MTTAVPPSELTVTVDPKPGSRVELRVEAPPSELESAIQASLKRLASRVRVPGFRIGKVPAPIVEKTVGWEVIRQDTVEHLVPVLFRRALDQSGVEAVDEPDLTLDPVERDQPLVFRATVTVTPEVELGDYSSIRVEQTTTEIGDEQVDQALEEVRQRHSDLVDVDRPADAGDVLRCTLRLRREDQILTGADGSERDIELDREKLIPGLVDGMVGLKAGESRSFWVTLPDDFPQEDLRGVEATAEVSVSAVRERTLPPADDALAVLDEHGTTLAELRDHLRAGLVEEAEQHDRELFRSGALTAFRDQTVVDIPAVMIDREIDRQVAELQSRLSQMGMDLEKYLSYTNSSIAQFRGERREEATMRVKLEIALDALAVAEGIEVDESQVEGEKKRISEGRKLTADQQERVALAARTDLRRRACSERVLEIARGEG